MTVDQALRPHDWDAYVGQEKLKDRLQISIVGAIDRNQPLDHVLLYGGPGCGKTSLAALIAQELQVPFHPYVMPIKMKALQKVFLESEGVIFLDEVHRLKSKDQENLLPILEDREIQYDNGNKVKLEQPFTVVAATTELSKLIKPLRDRFTHRPKFEEYSDEQMGIVVDRMFNRIGIEAPEEHVAALGAASAGVPRQARTLVFTSRDLGTTKPYTVLQTAGITREGLTEDHLEYLTALNKLGQVAGVDIMSNYTGQPKDILLDLEKLLVRKNFVEYTPKGRSLTMRGLKIVNKYKNH